MVPASQDPPSDLFGGPPEADPPPVAAPSPSGVPDRADASRADASRTGANPGGTSPGGVARPLADRLRPRTLADVVGQDHLVGPSGTLSRMLAQGSLASLILWGPPGSGKTTIARLLAQRSGLAFVQLSAVFSGIADLRRAFDEARRRRRQREGTLLFVD
ncbi:MAG: AAA family ATPase, partial [Acetobacteraceae bacterium]